MVVCTYVYMYSTNEAFGGMEGKMGTNYKVGGGWWVVGGGWVCGSEGG